VVAVRADRGGHDLAVIDDEALADRVDVLVAGQDQALVGGLADLVGAELVRRGDSDTGANGEDGESGGAGRCERIRWRLRLPRSPKRSFSTRRRRRVTCMVIPFGVAGSNWTFPSNCQSGLVCLGPHLEVAVHFPSARRRRPRTARQDLETAADGQAQQSDPASLDCQGCRHKSLS
jgi:hypothetical protein